MRCLLRTLVSARQDTAEYRDVEYVNDILTLGRASDCLIHLEGRGVQQKHAVLTLRGNGRARVKADGAAEIQVNGTPTRSANLNIGDRLRVGPQEFTLIQPPLGFDLALSQATAEEAGEEEKLEFVLGPMSLEEAGLKRRRWAWLLMLLTLIVGLVLPLIWSFWPDPEQRPAWMPITDEMWNPGPLSSAHHIPGVGDNCKACHTQPFVQVRDQDCTSCHKVGDHVPTGVQPSPFADFTCAGCHREHKEPAQLVRLDEAMCVDCHETLAAVWPKPPQVADVAGFANHPPFKLSLLAPLDPQSKNWAVQRLPMEGQTLREQSNLKFSHEQHMNAKGIDGPQGNVVLECSNCHQPEQDGKLMQPITMEKHCGSCHSLAFEPTDPERQAPHAAPDKVLTALEEYYARLYAIQGGPVESVHELRREARRPGQPTKAFYAAMKAWADERAMEAVKDLLENSACQSCHNVQVDTQAKGVAKWQVQPVRLTAHWLPKSDFDHAAHNNMQCVNCHAAADSKEAADVLVPGLDNCQQCHSGKGSGDLEITDVLKVETGCVGCHDYHFDHAQAGSALMQAIRKAAEQEPARETAQP